MSHLDQTEAQKTIFRFNVQFQSLNGASLLRTVHPLQTAERDLKYAIWLLGLMTES